MEASGHIDSERVFVKLSLPQGWLHRASVLHADVAAQQIDGLLWWPVWFGLGIALAMALPWAAQREHLLLLLGLCSFTALAGRWRRFGPLWLVLLLIFAGAVRYELRVASITTVSLARPEVSLVTATVINSSQRAEGRQRLLVEEESIGRAPGVRLLLNVAGDAPRFSPGDGLEGRFRLYPVGGPVLPGGYDRAARDWFAGIAGRGASVGPVSRKPATDPPLLAGAQQSLSLRLQAHASGDAGAVAAAVITGDSAAISAEAESALQTSSLYHLISVSGFHLAVVTGLVFLIVRRGLALIPRLALDWPLKNIAAVVAILMAIGYTLFTGAAWPTIRSCLGCCLVMLAILIGRNPVSLRLVAAAALAILLWRPEALADISFQFSFAAMCGLIAAQQSALGQRLWQRVPDEGLVRRAMRFLAHGALISLACELAIAPIALLHFNKIGLYGVLANAIAAPLMTWVIMPLGLLSAALAPLGLEALPAQALSLACQLLLDIATFFSRWPMARLMVADPGHFAFVLAIAGLLGLLLLRGRLRLSGIALLAAALITAVLHPQPDLVIAGSGAPVVLRAPGGTLVQSDSSGRSREAALLSSFATANQWPWHEGGRGFGLIAGSPRCAGEGCLAEISRDGRHARLWVLGRRADPQSCVPDVDLLIDGRWQRRRRCPATLVIDRRWLAQHGVTTMRLTADGWTIDTDRARRGDRPWVRSPWGEAYLRPGPADQ
jgi:competence protein ComEC